MFEMGFDYIADSDTFEVIGGYFSPVSDAYAKPGLAPWHRRVDMCSLAVRDSSWIMVDSWEPSQTTFVRTARVLDHFNEYLNGSAGEIGGVLMPDGIPFLLEKIAVVTVYRNKKAYTDSSIGWR